MKNKIALLILVVSLIFLYLCYYTKVSYSVTEEHIEEFYSVKYTLDSFNNFDKSYFIQTSQNSKPIRFSSKKKMEEKEFIHRDSNNSKYVCIGEERYTYEDIRQANLIMWDLHKDLEDYPMMAKYYKCLTSRNKLEYNTYNDQQAYTKKQIEELLGYNHEHIQKVYDKYKDCSNNLEILTKHKEYTDVIKGLGEYTSGNRTVNLVDLNDHTKVVGYNLDNNKEQIIKNIEWFSRD